MKTAEITDELWAKYKSTGDIMIRDEIVTSYMYLVKYIARKMSAVYKNHAEMEDIVGQGILVLMDSVEKFDPSKGVKFETFASIKIRGSVIDYIRKQDWVPRSLRKKARDIEDGYTELQNRLGREVSDTELAEFMGVETDELNRIMSETYSFNVLSYEELLQENIIKTECQYSVSNSPELYVQEDDLKRAIADGIDRLSEKERTVISLYYYEELKLKEIAGVLGVTEARVCQMHSKALLKLKTHLKDYMYT